MAIGEALAAACSDPAILARIGGSIGETARATRFADRMARARAMATARAAVPPGLRGVHPSWIETALVAVPHAREAVAAGGGDGVATWLARFVTARIPPMPPIDRERIATIDDASRVSAQTLAAWLADVGADQLAFALGPAIGRAALALGRDGDRARAAEIRIAQPPRLGALGPRRAAIKRSRVDLDDRALVRIGARAIATWCDALVRLRIACRLPRSAGVLDELLAHAATPREHAPRWAAIGA